MSPSLVNSNVSSACSVYRQIAPLVYHGGDNDDDGDDDDDDDDDDVVFLSFFPIRPKPWWDTKEYSSIYM